MITLAEHIEQLRAELYGCLDPSERAQIAAELETAGTGLDQQDDADRPPG
jgi:hypothetical protein